jgi:hypothetical protein
MRFHWIRDRAAQGQFSILWHPGSINLADYYTKTHPASHILAMCQYHVSSDSKPQHFKPEVRGCVRRTSAGARSHSAPRLAPHKNINFNSQMLTQNKSDAEISSHSSLNHNNYKHS